VKITITKTYKYTPRLITGSWHQFLRRKRPHPLSGSRTALDASSPIIPPTIRTCRIAIDRLSHQYLMKYREFTNNSDQARVGSLLV
jgi:hypothetical protein